MPPLRPQGTTNTTHDRVQLMADDGTTDPPSGSTDASTRRGRDRERERGRRAAPDTGPRPSAPSVWPRSST